MKRSFIVLAAVGIALLSCNSHKRIVCVFPILPEPITDTTPVVDTSGGTLKLSEAWKKHIQDN